MGSSTSSSEERIEATAAARPTPDLPAWRSIAPEGFERPVPHQPWRRVAALAIALLAIAVGAWEWRMRAIGLETKDLDDGKAHWAAERRLVDSGPSDQVVIVGDSRILFDTDLSVWEEMTGIRPIQLALPGTNARPFLEDLANDAHFAGLAVVGIAETSYFRDAPGLMGKVLDYVRVESPSQRAGQLVYLQLSRVFAFLDSKYALFAMIERLPWPEREGVKGDFYSVWKVSESYAHRQTQLWSRIERDEELRNHARAVWIGMPAKPPDQALIDRTIALSKTYVDKIRARGGEVVWIRAPSSGKLLEREQALVPREKVWDPLVKATNAYSIYYADVPEMRDLDVPEWSHLSAAAQPVFTRAYVGLLLQNVDWLKRRVAAREKTVPAD